MKKSLLIAAIAVFGITNVNAQDISLGVKAGANFSNTGESYAMTPGSEAEKGDMKIGLHIGVLAEFMLSEQFALQPELLYSMQGSKFEKSGEILGQSYSYEAETKLDYISLPILAKYYFTDGFSVHAGPQLGFLLSAKSEYESSTAGQNESDEMDIKDYTNSLDYGIAVGAGYKLEAGLFFNARYYFGLADIPDTDADVNSKNAVIQVSVGYMF